MAYNPMSAARLPADDPFFSAGPGNLPGESEASQLHSHGTRGSSHTRPYHAQTQDPNPVDLSTPRRQITTLQPNSVKHLTCWFWATTGCKFSDDTCLYSHFDTGMLAKAPVQVQRGRKCSSLRPSLRFLLFIFHFNSSLSLTSYGSKSH